MKKVTRFMLVVFIASSINIHGQITTVDNTVNLELFASSIGKNNQSIGIISQTYGYKNIAEGDYSTAIGRYLYAGAIKSVVIGSGFSENYKLINNNGSSLMVGFNSDVPTFYVTGSGGIGKTGKIGIGNVGILQAKLHLRSDNGENAAIFIEPNNWSAGEYASLVLGNAEHSISANNSDGLLFRTQKYFIFNGGNMGIGIREGLPETELDVAGTVKMKGLQLQNESAQTGYVLACGGLNGEAVWQNPANYAVWNVNEQNEAYRMSNVGIGIDDPTEKLEVEGNIVLNDAIIGRYTSVKGGWYDENFLTLKGRNDAGAASIMISKGILGENNALKLLNPLGEIQFKASDQFVLSVRETESVFGRPDITDYEVKVNGKIWAHEVEVKVLDWWDEVFDENYKLMPLHQLENYIETNNHLPEMPTESEALENGIELGKMNSLLLKKVEELTLYVIELKKEVGAMKKQQNTQTANYKGSND